MSWVFQLWSRLAGGIRSIRTEVCEFQTSAWSISSLLDQLPNLFYSTSLALAASALRLSSRSTAFRDSLILLPSRPMHFTSIC